MSGVIQPPDLQHGADGGTDPREQRAPVRHWAYREILLLAAVMVLAQTLALTAAIGLTERLGGIGREDAARLLQREPLIAVPVQIATWIPGLAYIFFVVTRQYGVPLRVGLGWRPLPRPAVSYVRMGALLALGAGLASFVLSDPGQTTPMREMFANRRSLWVLGAFGILLAPMLEEVVFRGFLFSALERAHGRWVALLGTSVLFSLLHGGQYGWQWQQLTVLLAVGCALGGVRIRSGSSKASTLVHGMYNAVLFLAVAYWPSGLG